MIPSVRKGGQGRGFREELVGGPMVEEFVVDAGRRKLAMVLVLAMALQWKLAKKNKGLANKSYGVKLGRKPRKTLLIAVVLLSN